MTFAQTCDWVYDLINWSHGVELATSVSDLQTALYAVEDSVDWPPPARSAARLIPLVRRYAAAAKLLDTAAQPALTVKAFEATVVASPRLLAAVRTVDSSARALSSWHRAHC